MRTELLVNKKTDNNIIFGNNSQVKIWGSQFKINKPKQNSSLNIFFIDH